MARPLIIPDLLQARRYCEGYKQKQIVPLINCYSVSRVTTSFTKQFILPPSQSAPPLSLRPAHHSIPANFHCTNSLKHGNTNSFIRSQLSSPKHDFRIYESSFHLLEHIRSLRRQSGSQRSALREQLRSPLKDAIHRETEWSVLSSRWSRGRESLRGERLTGKPPDASKSN